MGRSPFPSGQMTISRQKTLLKALGYFWMTPFCICMVIAIILLAALPEVDSVELPKPFALAIWAIIWLIATFLCTLAAVPVFLHHPVAERFERRLYRIAGLGGVMTCGLLYLA